MTLKISAFTQKITPPSGVLLAGYGDFRKLSEMVRRRLRSMKFKRISRHDNHKVEIKRIKVESVIPFKRANFTGTAQYGKAVCW